MKCTHRAIRSWSQLDGSPVEMWSCVDCGWMFEPRSDTKEASNSTEPVAWLLEAYDINEHKTLKRLVFERPNVNPGIRITPYYTHPPQRKPLTDEEVGLLTTGDQWAHLDTPALALFARAIERAHGIGREE